MKPSSILKKISLLLACLLIASLASCGKGEDNAPSQDSGQPSASGQTNDGTADETEPPETEAKYPSELSDYGGYTFTFLNNGDNFWQGTNHIVDYEEMTGEALADAIYTRNRGAEDTLNIKFAVEKAELGSGDGMFEWMQKAVMAMDDVYDVVYHCLSYSGQSTYQGGLTYNLHTVDSLNLDERWWNQSFIQSATVGDKMLYTAIDYVNLMSVSYCNAVFCNKQIMRANSLEYPYELVKSGKWTYDAMFSLIEAAKNIGTQEDWNPKAAGSAIYGLTGQHAETTVSLLQGSGVYLISKNDANFPAITEEIGRLIDAYDKMTNALSQSGSCMLINAPTGEGQGLDYFNNGRALFYGAALGHGSGPRMRESDVEYGPLPQAKADETQSRYYTPLSQYTFAMNIPKSASDPARTGAVMDYLCWLSYQNVLPHLMANMCYKGVSDPQDIEMINAILEAEIIDIGQIIDFTGSFLTEECGPNKMLAGNNTFSSDWNAQRRAVEKQMDKLFKNAD